MSACIISAFKTRRAKETMARGVIASFLGMFVMACSGCGGGGGSGDNQPAAKTPSPTQVTIDAQGDSTMYGYERVNGVLVQTPANPPAVLQAALRAQYGTSVTVENHGVGGSTIGERLSGVAPYTAPYTPDAAKIVIGNWALNDATQAVDMHLFQSNLVQFVTLVRSAGGIAVLEEPNPTTTSVDIDPYVEAIDSVAAQMNVPLIQQYSYITTLPNWQGLLTDGVHPNDQLYTVKAQRESAVIGPLVAQLLH